MIPSEAALLGMFLVFCRVGAALMLMPGLAASRVPVIVRLLFAFAVSSAFHAFLGSRPVEASPSEVAFFIVSELAFGAYLGFLCAMFLYAVRFAATFVTSLIGLAGIPGQPIDDAEASPALVTLVSLSFTLMVFALDLHLMSLRALLRSYTTYPVGSGLSFDFSIETVAMNLSETSLVAMQAASPFILHSFVVNFALGLIGKLTPQLQSYFALMGLSTLTALLILVVAGSPLVTLMAERYLAWLSDAL